MRFFSALVLTGKNAPTISLKAGVYRCPRTYGVDELHQLTQLMRAFCPSVERAQVLTWDHAATLEFLTPDTLQPTGNVLWALHGESTFTENERYRGLDVIVKERFAKAKPQWVFVLSESSTAVDTAWMESILGLALLRWIQEEFA